MTSIVRAETVVTALPRDSAIPVGGTIKRVLDIVGACVALVFMGPFLALLALVVWLQDGGPAFYRHQRIGFAGREFGCLKFRSMCVDSQHRLECLLEVSPEARAEWNAFHKLRVDPRITRVGGFLRKSSLDELPQLLNILYGEMSFVGPRPIVQAEVDRYGADFASYAATRPGLTGLWQVSGRTDVSYEARVAMDVAYAKAWTLRGDFAIVLRTLPAVLLTRGSY